MNPPRSQQVNKDEAAWPSLPLEEWRATRDTLHMWTQIVGKTRLALAPKQNHWWHVPLYLTSRGLTTTPIPYGLRTFQIEFDFVDHRLVLETSDGTSRDTPLRPQAVAEFYREYQGLLGELGVTVKLWPVPVEAEHSIPFPEDRTHASSCAWLDRRQLREDSGSSKGDRRTSGEDPRCDRKAGRVGRVGRGSGWWPGRL